MAKKKVAPGTKPTLLTQPVLDALEVGQRRRDTKVAGFFAERGVKGVSLKIQADLWQNGTLVRTVRKTLGRFPELSIDAGRAQAQILIGKIKGGEDPDAPERAHPGQMTVATMFERAQAHMTTLERRPDSISELGYMLSKYLPSLADKAVATVKPSTLRAEHERISREHGKTTANKAMRSYRSAFNIALKQADDPDALGANPVRAVTFHPERPREESIASDDLRDWYQRLQKIPNALRRLMHEINLFSGCRPGLLMQLERAWIQSDRIVVPRDRMKIRTSKDGKPLRPFVLPLSAHLAGLVQKSLVLSDMTFAGAPWLFPTRSDKTSDVVATQVIRERSMPSETGHILRKTYRTQAEAAGVSEALARSLMDHTVEGIEAHYVDAHSLFAARLGAQEKITSHILSLIK